LGREHAAPARKILDKKKGNAYHGPNVRRGVLMSEREGGELQARKPEMIQTPRRDSH